MPDVNIVLPSKPRIVTEEGTHGVYEIDGLYRGYAHTLGNSLRRIMLSSLPGSAITSIKIAGVNHEFSTIEGIKEDVISIVLTLKKVRFKIAGDEPQTLTLNVHGTKEVTAGDIETSGQVEILNPELVIAHLTSKDATLSIELRVENGLGYVSKEELQKSRVDIGNITPDANFTPIHRAFYEVEDMRVGDRTDFNRLRLHIETDGTLTPRQALEKSIEIMITQLKAIIGFKEEEPLVSEPKEIDMTEETTTTSGKAVDSEILKTRIESLNLSARTQNALSSANIRTVGGLSRKREQDILEVEGLGTKGLQEIKKALGEFGIILKN